MYLPLPDPASALILQLDEAQRDERVRNWDTCMFYVYSLEASGHNPRPARAERTRQRLMHKFSYWLEHV